MNVTQEVKIIKEIKITEVTMALRNDGIVHIHYNKNTFLNVELQLRLLDLMIEITEGVKSSMIYTADEGVVVTKSARENALLIEGKSPTKASAVVADSLAYRIIANFYMKVNKPKKPFRVVKNFEDGLIWLKSLEETGN
jgi:hypothetical protein